MKKSMIGILLQIAFYGVFSSSLFAQSYPIYVGRTLSAGYDMGVNTNLNQNRWLQDSLGYMKMLYPAGQSFGAVFITVGVATDPPRIFRNFSMYHSLKVEMKGRYGGEQVEIGLKDNTDIDNGQETKIRVTLTNDWEEYTFDLNRFVTADLTHLYSPIEFVFSGSQSKIVYFRNIRYN